MCTLIARGDLLCAFNAPCSAEGTAPCGMKSPNEMTRGEVSMESLFTCLVLFNEDGVGAHARWCTIKLSDSLSSRHGQAFSKHSIMLVNWRSCFLRVDKIRRFKMRLVP